MNNRNLTLVVGIVVLAVIAAGLYAWQKTKSTAAPASAPVTVVSYDSTSDGISFSYPSTYKLESHDLDISNMKGKYLTLLPTAAQIPQDGEGPPGLTVEIFENPTHATLAQWLQETTSGMPPPAAGTASTSVQVAGEPAIAYSATGLYESDNVAVIHGSRIYIFSASWLTREDQTLRDLENLLKTVQFK